jgi:hypothetical protein
MDNFTTEQRERARACHHVFTHKGWIFNALSSDRTFEIIFGHFHRKEDFDTFRRYIAQHVKYHEGFEGIWELIAKTPIYSYLANKLHENLDWMIVIDWRVWLMVQFVLVLQALAHYYLKLAVIELLPINVLIGICILSCQFAWTRRRCAYVVNPDNCVSSEKEGRTSEELEAREFQEKLLLWIQQLNFFFLCLSAARLLLSSFFWKDYFYLSCSMLVLFLVLYAGFLVVGSLTVPMFIIMYSVPPHVTQHDREDMRKFLGREIHDAAVFTSVRSVHGGLVTDVETKDSSFAVAHNPTNKMI